MNLKPFIFSVIVIAAFGLLFYNLKRLFNYLKIAQPENRWDKPVQRIIHTIKVALGQSKIMREKTAGVIHVAIFWGFNVFLFSLIESILSGLTGKFSLSFLGPVYSLITLTTDVFSVLIILAIIWALLRRFVTKVKRLQGDAEEKKDAIIVLLSIFVIVVSLLLENAANSLMLHKTEISITAYHIDKVTFFAKFATTIWTLTPISDIIGKLFTLESAKIIYEISWWTHIIGVFAFMNYLPFSKHFHVYTAVLNVYFSPLGFPNKVEKIDFEKEGVEKFGVVDVEDFGWKSLLDGYSCTHCGRCDSVCPAYTTGKVLSPRQIIIGIRERTTDKAPILLKEIEAKKKTNGKESEPLSLLVKEQEILDKKFVGDYQNVDALWQCTSCGACMMECPVTIEHVPAIINMRRSLVMMEANFPPLLQSAFSNLETNATPWAFPPSERADWAEGTGVKTAAENPDFDVLFWVGCSGSFDDRSKKISVAFTKLLQAAGINFAILGTEEQCNGDVARRAGNEYLADMLIKANIETLNRYNVKKIVTFCPHCFNIMKNEYPDFGGNYEVIHHTQYLNQLISEGKLKLKNSGKDIQNVAYHDSCYIGRYNNIYDEPRQVLHQIGLNVKEAKRHADKGFCCGAGGAQMFLEETEGKRVNIERTEELLETGSRTLVSNCPFCMTMLTDGVKAKDKVDEVEVKDIAEILLENLA